MQDTPIVDPKKFIAYLRECGYLKDIKPPKTVVIIFLDSLLKHYCQHFDLKKVEGFDAGELYLHADNPAVGVFYCRGVGAPIAIINLEELIAFGVKQFLVVGTAGALQQHLKVADTVICNSAIRDEGTSQHYNAKSNIAEPAPEWQASFKSFLQRDKKIIEGQTWTTDAPYRETKEKVKALQQQGVLCVEMEASALFAVAAFYQVSLSAAFVISDSLADLNWIPGFFSDEVASSLSTLANEALDFAMQLTPSTSANY